LLKENKNLFFACTIIFKMLFGSKNSLLSK
jgi:hypothetical protein